MNRRSFIKLFGYIPGLALLPSLVQAETVFDAGEVSKEITTLNDGNVAEPLYESLLSVSKFLEDIPKYGIKGNTLAYTQIINNRGVYNSTPLNPVKGECEWMGFSSPSLSVILASKAKSCGRKALDNITNSENGLISLAGTRKKGLQHLFDSNPEWIMAGGKEIRELKRIPELMKYATKHNIQIYRNDWMSVYKSEIIAGKFDDGTNTKGCTLIYSEDDSLASYKGLHLVNKGEFYTVTYYQNLVIWNRDDIVVIEA